jgi:DNA helicase-2/ATP-dependent DNA helicase PcrA
VADGGTPRARREPSRPSTSPDELLVGCDIDQVEAITTKASPLCILAGAGSGKTRVLTRRIAWRILDGSALAPHVLTLTFTRKAANELKQRLASLGAADGVTAGTFHAIALAELRRLAADRGQPAPVVLASKARLIGDLLDEQAAKGKAVSSTRRPSKSKGRSEYSHLIHDIAGEIEWAKARLVSPSEYEKASAEAGRSPGLDPSSVASLYETYEQERRRRRLLDFEDLLTNCAFELENDPGFAASARWRYRHIFVDEYQDVNAAQLAVLRRWCSDEPDLCVVGDPHQAIYGWNGSDPRAILKFPEHFPNATVQRLRANYRSTGEILAVAAAVLGIDETPRVAGPSPEGPVPTLRDYEDDVAEAAGVAELVRLAHRPGRTWSQIAVLARTNAQLSSFRRAFEARQIPYRALGDYLFLRKGAVATALSELSRAANATVLSALAADLREASQATREEDDEPVSDEEGGGLLELAEMVEDYLRTDVVATGAGFRSYLETTLRAGDARDGSDAVDLVTFHRAKGLEWPVVFVTGLEDGLVPIAHAKDETSLSEERRLLYVACTRAEEELHCSWAKERSFSPARSSRREPSPYLAQVEQARRRLARLQGRSVEAAREALAASRRALSSGSRLGP